MKKIAILAASSLIALSACASGPSKEEVTPVIESAKAENAAAKKMGFMWRDAGKMIKKAEAALKEGDTAQAMKLAKKAEFQGKMAQIQAKEQANAGPAF
ncbi:MAG: SoxXA-binding protein [Gammaproteobacteria bacterium]|nr:SoxXA-binding protein [Gammaproteobacteria bacterium]